MDDAIFYVVCISLARVLVFFFSLFSRGALDLTERENLTQNANVIEKNRLLLSTLSLL